MVLDADTAVDYLMAPVRNGWRARSDNLPLALAHAAAYCDPVRVIYIKGLAQQRAGVGGRQPPRTHPLSSGVIDTFAPRVIALLRAAAGLARSRREQSDQRTGCTRGERDHGVSGLE